MSKARHTDHTLIIEKITDIFERADIECHLAKGESTPAGNYLQIRRLAKDCLQAYGVEVPETEDQRIKRLKKEMK